MGRPGKIDGKADQGALPQMLPKCACVGQVILNKKYVDALHEGRLDYRIGATPERQGHIVSVSLKGFSAVYDGKPHADHRPVCRRRRRRRPD